MSHVDDVQLHGYVDGELEPDEVRLVEAHVDSCDACRSRVLEEQRVRERAAAILADAVPPPMTPPSFDKVRTQADAARSGRKVRRLTALRPLAWAATIIMAVAVGWFVRDLRAPSEQFSARAPATGTDSTEPTLALAEQERPMERDVKRADSFEQSADATDPTVGRVETAPTPPFPAEAMPSRAREIQDRLAPARAETGRGATPEDTALQPPAGVIAQRADAPSPVMDQLSVATPLADSPLVIPGPTSGWLRTNRQQAQAFAGGHIATIEGLPVLLHEIRHEGTGDRRLVRVTQRLPSGETIQLVQQRAEAGEELPRNLEEQDARRAVAARSEITALTDVWGESLITLQAPIAADSLRVLWKRIR